MFLSDLKDKRTEFVDNLTSGRVLKYKYAITPNNLYFLKRTSIVLLNVAELTEAIRSCYITLTNQQVKRILVYSEIAITTNVL